MCEGDDYWTDPYKLQKQVDFLEGHPEYSMCFHNAMVHWENGQFPDAPFAKLEDRDYIGEEIYENWIVPTASVVFRKKVLKSALYVNASTSKMFVHGDIILFLSCAAFGKIRGVRDIMSVYRRHVGGVTFIKNMSMLTAQVRHNKNIPRYFGDKYLQLSKKRIAQVSIFAFLSTKLRYWDFLKIAWENSRKFTCVFLMQGIHSWLKVHLRIDV